MFTKVVSIKNIGRFKDYSASGDVTLKRLNVFFGPNGRGKTTLCEILRSLQTANPEIVNGRRTLTSTASPSVELRSSGASFSFRNGTWSASYPDLAIFDTSFVYANVYSGEAVSLDNKRNLYRVIVGERGVELAKEVEDLDELLRASAKRVASAKSRVERLIPKGTSLESFVKLSPIDNVDQHVETARRQVSTLENAAEIKAKSLLKPMAIYSLPDEFFALLTTTLPDVSASATALVEQHVATHTMGATNNWLSTGLTYIKDDECPFCGLANSGSALFDAYRTVFSKAFAGLRSRIIAAQAQLQSSNPIDSGKLLTETQRANLALAQYWQQFLEVVIPDMAIEDYVSALTSVLTAARGMIDRKLADPLQSIADDGQMAKALAQLNAASEGLFKYNEAIATANVSIQQKKSDVDAASLQQHKVDLAKLELAQIRFEADGVAACDDYTAANHERELLEKRKKLAKEKLDQYTDAIFGKYQDRINVLLTNFGAGFRIQDAVRNYAGGTPSTSYHIVIDDVPVDIGDNKSPIDKPSFRNTLSAGDRSALAFAFFVARIQIDGDCSRKVLVFDDPFSSQDRSRRACTQQIICKLAQDAAQVIVLSHDHSFLRTVWDGAPDRGERKSLQLRRMGKDTIITECDIEHETKPNYLLQHAMLKDFTIEGKGQVQQVARTIRPIMEEYLRLTFPNQFTSTEWLGDFIKKIREADDDSVLKTAQAYVGEIEAINDYSKGFHHSAVTNSDETIDDTELSCYCQRVLDLIEGF